VRGQRVFAGAVVAVLVGGALTVAGCVNVTTSPKPSSSAGGQGSTSGASTSKSVGGFVLGQSVAAIWSDGNLYLAEIASISGEQITVKYADDSSTRTVTVADVKPIPGKTWAVGDEVKAVWSSGRFYDGVITKANGSSYEVKWDDGSAPSEVPGGKIIPR
jgi:hypothetical protein